MRLAGNAATAISGRLELYIDSADTGSGEVAAEWGTVCGKKFRMREAHVACRQLGYYSAVSWNFSANVGLVDIKSVICVLKMSIVLKIAIVD